MAEPYGNPPPVAIGARVGRYEIAEELGHGGMGVVFRARDRDLGREVALKSPWPKFAGNQFFRSRFLREARIASRLTHPSIVTLYEVFEHDGAPWLAMQLVEGRSLREILDHDGPLPMVHLMRYADQLAAALDAAHTGGILHRDINPRNILIASDADRAMLTDFGLARFLAPPEAVTDASTQTSVTNPGQVMGTPHYMSPEQILAKPLEPTTDVFSLGAVLYEMATGVRAFPAQDRSELLNTVLHREPEPISRHTYEVPGEFERIVRKCLAKRPAERYQDARDLRVDLRTLRHQLDLEEYSGSNTELASAPPGWRLKFTMSTATVVLIAIAVVTMALQGRGDPTLGTPFQVTAGIAWEGEPELSPDGGRIAFTSDAAGNPDIHVIDTRGGRPLALTTDSGADEDPTWMPDGSSILFTSYRNGEPGVWRVGQFGGTPMLLVSGAAEPAVSPNGQWLAFSRVNSHGTRRVAIAPLVDPGRITVLTGDDDGVWDHRSPAWSPDGERIAYAAAHNLWTVRMDGGAAKQLTDDDQYHESPVWSPDGKRIYFASVREGTTALWWVEAKGGTPRRLTLGTGPELHPSLSPDGTRLAYSTTLSHQDIVMVDLDGGTEQRIPALRDSWMPALAPDGSRLVVVAGWGSRGGNLWMQDLSGTQAAGQPHRLTDDPAGQASHPVFSPDGRWIAYYRIIKDSRDLWILPTEGGLPTRVTDADAADIHPAWSPDGTRLAFASDRDGETRIWIVPVREGGPAGSPRRLTDDTASEMAPDWSPDGTAIAYSRELERESEIWIAVTDGTAPPRALTSGVRAVRVRWRDDERLLVSAFWGEIGVSIREVSRATGETTPLPITGYLGSNEAFALFDITPDGKVAVVSREDLTGDLWTLEFEP